MLDHLIVAKKEPVLASEFGFAESFPEVDADRSAGGREIWKGHVVANDDGRDDERRCKDDCTTDCEPTSPWRLNDEQQRDRPTDRQIQWIDSNPTPNTK